MDTDGLIQRFCDATGADPADVEDRWAGRPDRIIEDIFRFPDDYGEPQKIELFGPYQPKFVHAYFYGDASTLNFLKGRRIGGTAVAVLCMALEGLTMPNQLYPIVVTKEEQAYSRIDDLRQIFNHSVFDVPLPTDNKGTLELWNGTKYMAYTSKPEGARGDGARSILFDEMAFMEKQEEQQRAFNPMLSLSNGKLLQISTPNSTHDLFMETQKKGTESGYTDDGEKTGVISLFQPTFHNAEEIDIEVPLWNQDLKPARPDLNIDVVESDRAQDPMGFQQEYLCIPAEKNYQFFAQNSIEVAMEAGEAPDYAWGEFTVPQRGGQNIMFVDVGVSHDDTVISVFEHTGDRRYQRHIEAVGEDELARAGILDPDVENVEHLADRIAQVFRQMNCEFLVFDQTGAGQFLKSALGTRINGGVIPFNFSDYKKVADIFGNMNAALRNGRVTLVPDDQLKEQLLAITRIQKKDSQVPRFSGKDTAPEGKDDMAISAVMSAFPPGFSGEGLTMPAERQNVPHEVERPAYSDEDSRPTGGVSRVRDEDEFESAFAGGSLSRTRTSSRGRAYKSRHARR